MKGSDLSTFLLVLVILAVAPPLPAAWPVQDAPGAAGEPTLVEIEAHLEAGRLDEAIESVVARVKSVPGDAAAWDLAFDVFDAVIAAGDRDGLMETAVLLTEEGGDRSGSWILLGKVYLGQAGVIRGITGFEGTFRQGLLHQAAESFREALAREPGSAEAGNHLAYTLFLLRSFRDATAAAETVVKENPDDGYARYLLGEIALREERHEDALGCFRIALERDGEILDALSGEVRALTRLERRSDAGRALLRLVEKDPLRVEIPDLAAALYEMSEMYLDAAALYREILKRAPESTDVVFRLAVVECRVDELDAAQEHVARVLEREPGFDGALYLAGFLAEKGRRYDEALQCYLKALACEGGYLELTIERLKVLAFTKARNGLFDEAVTIYDRLTPILPFDTILAGNRALALSQCGRRSEADDAYRAILEISPRDSQIVNDYALHLVGTGRLEEGLRLLEAAVAIDGCLDACENLGSYWLYTAADPAKAESYFTRVLEIDPSREKSLVLRESIRRNRARGGD